MMTEVTLGKDRIAAAILAGGGAARHDGFPKGLLEVSPGMSIIDVEIRQLTSSGLEKVIIVTNDSESYRHCEAQIVPDLRSGIGPLAGIEAALAYYGQSHDATLFLPCDLPGITTNEISRLQAAFISNSGLVAVAVTSDFLWEPLCTVVHNDLLKPVSQAIEDGQRRPQMLWRDLGAIAVHFEDATPFFNVNTPQDLARWQARSEKTL